MSEWERCKPWIIAALEYARGTHSIESVEAGIREGRYTFWPGEKSAGITEIHAFPHAAFLHVFLAGGDLDEIRDVLIPIWRLYALKEGLTKLTLCGRRGWERALKKQGWQADLICMQLPVVQELEQ